MFGRIGACIAVSLLLILVSGCHLPSAVSQPSTGPGADPGADQTRVSGFVAATLSAAPPSTPTFTPTASETRLPTFTFTLTSSIVMVSVSVETNCRTGPGKAYPSVGVLFPGESTEVLGRDSAGDYWVVRNPDGYPAICWLWAFYASVTGDWRSLPAATAPPTPTPAPSFTFSYDSFGIGPGYQCFNFEVTNTGAVTWESFSINFNDTTQGYTAAASSDKFTSYDAWCSITLSQLDLAPGESGNASVNTSLGADPSGDHLEVSLRLCSGNGLTGTCMTLANSFTP